MGLSLSRQRRRRTLKLIMENIIQERRRSGSRSPFTYKEKQMIEDLVSPHLTILEDKKTNKEVIKEKEAIWCHIAKMFNSSPSCGQETSPQQLKKAWINMRTRAKKSPEQNQGQSGRGSSISDADDTVNVKVEKYCEDGDGGSRGDDTDEDAATSPDEDLDPLNNITTPHPEEPPTKKRKRSPSPPPNTEEEVKLKILQNDLKFRTERNMIELAHLKRSSELKEAILLKELFLKKRMIEIAEAEHKINLKSIRTRNLYLQ